MTSARMLATLAAGYSLGRLRPFDQLRDRVWRTVVYGATPESKVRQNLLLTAFAVLHPVTLFKGWRKSKEPKPEPVSLESLLNADFVARMNAQAATLTLEELHDADAQQ